MRRSGFLFGIAGLAAGCTQTRPVQHFEVLDPAAQALRSKFDAARDKVRILMLVSPT